MWQHDRLIFVQCYTEKCNRSQAIVVKICSKTNVRLFSPEHDVVFCFLSIRVQVFAGRITQVELLCLGLQPELREQRRQAGAARGRAGGTRRRRAGSSSGRGRRQSQGPQPRKHGSTRGRQHRSRRRRRHRCPAWVRRQRLMWFCERCYLVWLLGWPTCPSLFWRPFPVQVNLVQLVPHQFSSSTCSEKESASPPVDIFWAMMIVWMIRGKIIRTVLCCVAYGSCAQRYTHTYEQFLKMSVSLGFVFLHLFGFNILCVCFFWFSLDYLVLVLLVLVLLDLISSVLHQAIG